MTVWLIKTWCKSTIRSIKTSLSSFVILSLAWQLTQNEIIISDLLLDNRKFSKTFPPLKISDSTALGTIFHSLIDLVAWNQIPDLWPIFKTSGLNGMINADRVTKFIIWHKKNWSSKPSGVNWLKQIKTWPHSWRRSVTTSPVITLCRSGWESDKKTLLAWSSLVGG